MITPTWSTFITNHPDGDNLTALAGNIADLIHPAETIATNIQTIQCSKSTILLTLDPFTNQATPHFHHDQIGLPLPGQTTHLIALQGFTTKATTIELDKDAIFTHTQTQIKRPSLSSLLSFHDKTVEELKEITMNAAEKYHRRKTAVLPPPMVVLLIASRLTCPWTILYQAITIIHNQNNTSGPTAEYAKDYFPLLLTLWSFTRSTRTETKAINHIARSATTDQASTHWSNEAHKTHIPTPQQPGPLHDDNIADGINQLAKTIEDQHNDKFATTDNETTPTKDKVWKKLNQTFQKVILFASTTDGETPAETPTPRMIALLRTRNGPNVTRLFQQWHTADMVVQTGMATNITKGCLVSFDGPFEINTFSPFFTPPQRAGFNILSHDEINRLALLT